MARTKRQRKTNLTKTGSKGRDHKSELIQSLRNAVDEYKNIYVFSFENLRETKFTEVRMDWRESKIFLGKHTVAQVALGKGPEDEFKDNLHQISKLLSGDVGLLFTNREDEEVSSYFGSFESIEFAKSGFIPSEEVNIAAGVLPFPTSMLDQLRKLGLIVEVDDSKIVLREPFVASAVGVPLTPEQAKVLTHFGLKTVPFSIKLEARWRDGEFFEL